MDPRHSRLTKTVPVFSRLSWLISPKILNFPVFLFIAIVLKIPGRERRRGKKVKVVSWNGRLGQYSVQWVPGKASWKSKDGWYNYDAIIHAVPFSLYKYGCYRSFNNWSRCLKFSICKTKEQNMMILTKWNFSHPDVMVNTCSCEQVGGYRFLLLKV